MGEHPAGPPGHPGVEAPVPLMMTQALAGRFTLAKTVGLVSTKLTQLFNPYPPKGIFLTRHRRRHHDL